MTDPCPDKKRPEQPKLEEPPLEEYQRPPCETSPKQSPKTTTSTSGKKKPNAPATQPGKKPKGPTPQSNENAEKSPCPSPLLLKTTKVSHAPPVIETRQLSVLLLCRPIYGVDAAANCGGTRSEEHKDSYKQNK
ncbi:hypothetical protein ElyMa_000766900 [Elysia marginata]|uniref:Uncharacterized protein n=1 Tax=Elysia marginata TaxID=1093978 RepID=A0AAV4GQY8_9GAST|nr:hypothetical protein ElyMa_000766900 [Elysia marginata]